MDRAPIAVEFELPPLEAPPAPVPLADVAAPLDAARAEADAIRAAAREEGFAAGLEEARAELAPAVAGFLAAAAALEDERVTVAADCEVAAVELALRIATQILAGALDAEPERIVDVVRGALRRLVERERITVLVNPDDLEAVRAAVPELVAELGGIEHCEVQAERRVSRGGAVVRTGEGEVDATLETKFERVREVVRDELAG